MAENTDNKRPPATEADIEAYTIGGARHHGATVHLADYNPKWPELFIREAARIKRVLGETIFRIEHVGSTSVPGLASKPRGSRHPGIPRDR